MSDARPNAIELVANRFSPFARDIAALEVTEQHVIPASPYRLQLNEVPIEEHPSAVWVSGFREVYTDPASGQYRVDYTYGTGLMKFNAANAGEGILVRYKGMGSALSARVYNAVTQRDPDVWAAGYRINDWEGTHFGWDPSSPPIYAGWELTQAGSGGYTAHEYSVFSMGRSPSAPGSPYDHGTMDARYVLQQWFARRRGAEGGGMVLQARVRNPYEGQGGDGSLFLTWEYPCNSEYGLRWTEQDGPTTVETTTDAGSTTIDLIVGYPPWTCLPCGLALRPGATAHFVTFTRSQVYSELNTFCWVVGAGVENAANIPQTQIQTQGGWLTDVSSFFNKGVTGWYDVRIELQPHEARLYVDDLLAAVHNTHVPNAWYMQGIQQYHMHATMTGAYAANDSIASRHDIDYFAVGPLSTVTPWNDV